jgi:putative ABC transport system permease protein
VFGSTEKSIVASFLKMNLLSVVVAAIISVPITLFFFNRWLENYTYRVEISWWVFIITVLIAAIVVFPTIIFQALKASRINPVEALRYE